MSKLAKYKNFIIFSWSADQKEKDHVHVAKNRKQRNPAKFWIEPVSLFDKGDLADHEINDVEKMILKYVDEIKDRIEKSKRGERFKLLIIRK